jgi:hypothetical protein
MVHPRGRYLASGPSPAASDDDAPRFLLGG